MKKNTKGRRIQHITPNPDKINKETGLPQHGRSVKHNPQPVLLNRVPWGPMNIKKEEPVNSPQ